MCCKVVSLRIAATKPSKLALSHLGCDGRGMILIYPGAYQALGTSRPCQDVKYDVRTHIVMLVPTV